MNEQPHGEHYIGGEQQTAIQKVTRNKLAVRERQRQALELRLAGKTFQVIADKYHITRQRVNQIYCAHSRAQLSSPPAAQD